MADSPGNNASAAETLNPSLEEIKPLNTESTNDAEPFEQLQQENLVEAGEATAADEEVQPSSSQSIEGQESAGKRKREDIEEENEGTKSSLHPLWKTSLCSYFRRQSGHCSHGDACRYAHGEEELRPRPDNSWDPTSERAKKLLKTENEEKNETSDAEVNVLMTDAFVDSSDPARDKCVVHLPRKWASDNLKSYLDEQGILYKTAKKKKGMTVGFVSFENTEQVKNAIEILGGKTIGNKQIKVADVLPRSFEKKAKSTISVSEGTGQATEILLGTDDSSVSASINGCENNDTVEMDKLMGDGLVAKARNACDVVTPLAHMSYADQLEHKKNSLMQTLKKLTRNARKACPEGIPLPEWILKSRDIGGLPCKLEGILESPLVNGYRNKCEFSVGYSFMGKPTVGFMIGNFRDGVTAVEEPVDCPNISKIACKFAAIFQEFLQHSSLPLWNRINNTGFWRQLTVREGRSPGETIEVAALESNISEVMLMIQVCSSGFDDELVTTEFERMAQSLALEAAESSPPLPLTVLVVQDHTGISNAAPVDAPLRTLSITKAETTSGPDANDITVEARIHDYISNLRFSISPTAFFQVNTLAAEKLYSLAGDWAGLGPDTLLFDICCGTGTIGLTLAHRVGMVVGIEMNASAVSDAQRNAEINGIKNCRFICAKAEDVMGSLLKEYLNVPSKQDESPHVISEDNGKDDLRDLENLASVDNGADLEESRIHELGDDTSSSGCPNNGSEELEGPIERSCISEDTSKTVQQYKDVVAIVDPPRVGLHPVVIKALRTHPRLRRLVYISCNPESLVANAIELCTPSTNKPEKGNKNNRGWRKMSSAGLARHRTKSMPSSEPFHPVKAMAVDLFPHTQHCEMVMLLER
ncbi:PREDICTED: zinc finger CCCH domain-containing protein 24 isoform X2 [Nelumbo nucifera]|nr:PREDICTED: zinc finger CCCH domain-containing protein 24 isoform X2 [Nelumbo nucifera]DAD26167.1 TPA_asm: hypothetical protein HUJ06_027635 [Nelumbo nucifera]